MKYLDPKNDIVFKKIFGKHAHLLISLLNDLLILEGVEQIQSLTYLAAEQVPDVLGLKNSSVDVKCVAENGAVFIVEMQMLWTDAFKKRVLLNASKAIVAQLNSSEDYSEICPVYSLNILNHIYAPDDEEFYHRFEIVEEGNTHEKIEGLKFVFIELPKFMKNAPTKYAHLHGLWLKFLKIDQDPQNIPAEITANKLTAEALKMTEESYFSTAEKEAYDRSVDFVKSSKTLINESRRKGLEEGLEEGLAKGIEQGIEQGILKGNLETARKMKIKGAEIEFISEMTGLSMEIIDTL